MRDRKKVTEELLTEILPLQFAGSCKTTVTYVETHCREIVSGLLEAFEQALEKAAYHQEKGAKGEAGYILLSHLHTSMLLRRYLIRIDVMDRRFYADLAQTESYWDAECIYRLFEKDIREIKKQMENALPRIRPYEMDRVRYLYAPYYHGLTKEFLREADVLFRMRGGTDEILQIV